MTALRYHTPVAARYTASTARAARRVAGVFNAHLWGLGDLPTDLPSSITTPTGVPAVPGGATDASAQDATAVPTGPAPVPDDATTPTLTTGLLAVGMGSLYGGAIGAVASSSIPGTLRGGLAAGGLSAFGVALAYATLGQRQQALGFGLGAAGAVGLAIYLAVRARRS